MAARGWWVMAGPATGGGKGRGFLKELFDQFARECAVTVMVRATLEHALSADALDELFAERAERGYTRELLFSALVGLMVVVVCRVRRSIHAAYRAMARQLGVSIRAVYDKLNRLEPQVAAGLVRYSAERLAPVIRKMGGALEPLLPGYRLKILDGNHLAATERRLKVLRGSKAGPLPGQCLVVLDPSLMLAIDVVPCEDGHAQERSLLDRVIELVCPGDLWMADRNFCTLSFLFGIVMRKAFFIVRHHAGLAWRPLGPRRAVGRVETGKVYEQAVAVPREGGPILRLRRITLVLDRSTRDGHAELHILTNLPERDAPARQIAELYRERWRVETLFAELERNLQGEIDTLGYPKAALFAFCTALLAYNVLSTARAALRAQHGAERIEREVSSYYLADELSGNYRGMMVALPAAGWTEFQVMTPARLAAFLVRLAANVPLWAYRKSPRGPKLARRRTRYARHTHVSTARLLAAQRRRRSRS